MLTNKKGNFFINLEETMAQELKKKNLSFASKKRQEMFKNDFTLKTSRFNRNKDTKKGQAGYLSIRLAKAFNVPRYSAVEIAPIIKKLKFRSFRKFKKYLYYRLWRIRKWISKLGKHNRKFYIMLAMLFRAYQSRAFRAKRAKFDRKKLHPRYVHLISRLWAKSRDWRVRRTKIRIRPSFRFRYFFRYLKKPVMLARRRKYSQFFSHFSRPQRPHIYTYGYSQFTNLQNITHDKYQKSRLSSITVKRRSVFSRKSAVFSIFAKSSKFSFIHGFAPAKYLNYSKNKSVLRVTNSNFVYRRIPAQIFRFLYLKSAQFPLIFNKHFFFTRFFKKVKAPIKRYYSRAPWYATRSRFSYFFKKYKLATKFSSKNFYKQLLRRFFVKKKRFSFSPFFGVFDRLGSIKFRFRRRRARYMRSHRLKFRRMKLRTGVVTSKFRKFSKLVSKLSFGIHFFRSVNNIFINVSTRKGRSVYSYSAGRTTFKGSKRLSPAAAELMGKHIGYLLKNNKIFSVAVILHSPLNYLFRAALRGLSANLKFSAFKYYLTRPHNGLRLRASRRV